MQSYSLNVSSREKGNKSARKNLRKENFVPSICYGEGSENKNISINRLELEKAFRQGFGESSIFNLKFEKDTQDHFAVIKELQIHPLTEKVLHADFMLIDMNKPIHTPIHIEFTGQSVGVKSGGILEHGIREIEVEILPTQIPQFIEVDVSKLDIGQSIHVSDITLENGKILSPSHSLIAKVDAPKIADLTAEEEEDSDTEPEVIEKGKKTEEE